MSMLSMQIDELRRTAQTYRDLGRYEAERMALDAADTIWELRDDLQRANADNAKLRELVRDMWELGFGDNSGANNAWAWHEEADALEDRMRELGIEVS